MKLTKKGFTLIELLAVITILGILSGIAVVAVIRYKDKTIQQSYSAMEKTVYDGAQTYIQKKGSIFTGTKTVSVQTLIDEGYIPTLQDPKSDDHTCSGEVLITRVAGSSTIIDKYTYVVKINCISYKSQSVACISNSSTCTNDCSLEVNKNTCHALTKKQDIGSCNPGYKMCIEDGVRFES